MKNKRSIAYTKRKITIWISILITVVFSVALVIFGIIGFQVSKTSTKTTVNTTSEIQHDLVFAENPLYNENYLDFGDGYVTKYVNAIHLNLLYNFVCDLATDIHVTYRLDVLLDASWNGTDLLWKKEYSLIPERHFSNGNYSDSFTLPLQEYKQLAYDIGTNTGVSTSAVMTITYTVNASALVAGTPVTDTSVSTLAFDLSKDVLVINGEPKQERTTPIEETLKQDLIPKRTALYVIAPLLFLSACGLAFLLIFTRGVREDTVKLQLSKLYKKYGSRIAELEPGPDFHRHNPIMVRSFKDLLLTADELKKPIFKKNADDSVDVEFFVIDEVEVYIFRAHSLLQLQKEK